MDVRDAVVKLFSAGLFLAILEFGAIIYFTRELGADAIGSFFLFQALVGIMAIPSNLGLRRAAEKELSAGEDTGEVIGTTILLKSVLLLPFLVSILLARSYVDAYINIQGVALFVAIGLATTQARRLVIRLLAGQMRVERTASLRVVGKIAWLIGGAFLISYGFGPLAILIAFIIGDLIIVVGGLVQLDLAFSRPTSSRARSLLSYGRFIFLRSSGSYIYSWMDVAILGFFVSTSLVGAYEIAWRVSSLALQLTEAVRESIFPQIARLHSEGKIDDIRELLYRWIQPPLYLTIPALTGAIVLGEEVLGVPFGQEVVVALPVLIVFMAEKIMRTVHLLYSAAVFAMDRPELGYRGEVVGLSMNLVLNLTLIPIFGILGAAVATTASSIVTALVNGYYLSSIVDIRIPAQQLVWSALSATLMAVGVYFAKSSLPPNWVGLFIGVSIGIVMYGIFMLSNGDIRYEIREFTNAIG